MPIPIRERGYPHPELLAETDWLAGRLSDPTIRVVDARSDKDFSSGHIPAAVNINGFSLGGIRPGSEMPKPEAFAHLVGPLGIDEHTPVVVYDEGGRSQWSQLAGKTAWTFLYYGHPDVRYLDGGLAKWTAEGLPLSSDAPAQEPRTFAARLVESVYCSLDQAKASVDDDGVVVWDVRSVGEFEGTTKGWNAPPRLGHLPGAIHLDYTEFSIPTTGRSSLPPTSPRSWGLKGSHRRQLSTLIEGVVRARVSRRLSSRSWVTTGHRTTLAPLTNGPISLTPKWFADEQLDGRASHP